MDLEKLIIGNGGGSVKTLAQVKAACKTPMTRVTVGSITLHARPGNTGETYYFHPQRFWSLNSLGLPNIGIEAYGEQWREMLAVAHGEGKELWANISPFSSEECAAMTDRLLCAGLDGVEINGSCPNVWVDGKPKKIPALDPEAADDMFRTTAVCVGNLSQVSFKLSPTRDLDLLKQLVGVFKQHQVGTLVACNTKGGQRGVRVDGRQALAFKADNDPTTRHEGGLAGTAIKSDALFLASHLVQMMPEACVIGLGGIFTGADADDYLDAGCLGIQSTTGYMEFGGQLFVDILMHLSDKVPA